MAKNKDLYEKITEKANEISERASKPYADALDWVVSLVYAVLFVLALNLFVFRSITVDGP